jgi:hypothetical protein
MTDGSLINDPLQQFIVPKNDLGLFLAIRAQVVALHFALTDHVQPDHIFPLAFHNGFDDVRNQLFSGPQRSGFHNSRRQHFYPGVIGDRAYGEVK